MAARVARRVVDYCARLGHDPAAFCEGLGLSWSALCEPEARLPYETVFRLGEAALELTGDANLGLKLAHDVGATQHYDAGLMLMMASASVRVALERMEAYQRYWGDGDRAALETIPGGLVVRYTLSGARGEYARHAHECALAEVVLGIRALAGLEDVARAVRFRHAAPRDLSLHQQVFRCPLEFSAARYELELADVILDAPMTHANEVFCALFADQVERAIARLPRAASTSKRVREVLRAALSGGHCTLAGTARALGMSARTLQRRLAEDGTSFAEAVDVLRHELAVAYLERDVPIPEIVKLLGYADAASFHHAFARWTGSSPKRYRDARSRC